MKRENVILIRVDDYVYKRIEKKKAAIKESVRGELSQADIWLIRECLEFVGSTNHEPIGS